jgi:hypothetical protein
MGMHDMNEEMNPIGYFVYLQMINHNESLKIELLADYKNSNMITKSVEISPNQQ